MPTQISINKKMQTQIIKKKKKKKKFILISKGLFQFKISNP